MKSNGIVVKKISNGQVIVLTKEGEFLAVTTENDGNIGEEVSFNSHIRQEEIKGKSLSKGNYLLNKRKYIASIAAIFLLFFIGLQGFVGSPFQAKKVAAYVSMDINPSVEMGISSDQIVLEAIGLNPDGIKLIDNLRSAILKQPIEEATALIMDEVIKQKYLKENSEVVIAMTKLTQNEQLDNEIEQKVKKVVEIKVKELPEVHITSIQTTEEDRVEAQVNQLSSGKYAIYKMAKDKGYEMPINQLKDRSIQEMMREYQEIEKSSQDKVMQNEKNIQNKLKPKFDKNHQIEKPEDEDEKDEKEKTPMNMGEQKKNVSENNVNGYEKVKQNNQEKVNGNEKDNKKSNEKEKIAEDEDNEIEKSIKKDFDKEKYDKKNSEEDDDENKNGNSKRIKNKHE